MTTRSTSTKITFPFDLYVSSIKCLNRGTSVMLSSCPSSLRSSRTPLFRCFIVTEPTKKLPIPKHRSNSLASNKRTLSEKKIKEFLLYDSLC